MGRAALPPAVVTEPPVHRQPSLIPPLPHSPRSYWSALLLSVLTGNELLGWLVQFQHFTTAMFGSSLLFTLWHSVKFARDLRHVLGQGGLPAAAQADRGLRSGWKAACARALCGP